MLESGPGGRSPRVDLLRGLAILLVLLLHFTLSYRLDHSALSAVVPRGWFAVLLNGNYGVTMFFVVSGYLITGNTIRRHDGLGRTSLRAFYTRRAARILPPLLLALAIIVPLGWLGVFSFASQKHGVPLPPWLSFLGVLSVLTFWHNVLMESLGYFNYCLNIYWSLSVEEVFYLAFPLACGVLRREGLIALLCVALIAVAPAYRAAHLDNDTYFMYGYLACFDAIALGCLTALLRARLPLAAGPRLLLTLGGSALLAVSWVSGIDGHEVWGFTAVGLATALLLAGDVPRTDASRGGLRWMGALPLQGLRWLGRHSYELYLFHILVLAALRNLVPPHTMAYAWTLPGLVAFLAASMLLAHLVARCFADPINLALRRRAGLPGRASASASVGLSPGPPPASAAEPR